MDQFQYTNLSSSNSKQLKVVFVCTGNTCRSCMAEGIFKACTGVGSATGPLTANSRGIHAFDGDPASQHSIKALKNLWNIDISIHKAKMLRPGDADDADLILTMTRQHRDILKSRYPGKASAIFTLKEYAFPVIGGSSEASDITDPYGMPYEYYESCAREIYDSVQEVIKKLQ